jgi:hypothetical protein
MTLRYVAFAIAFASLCDCTMATIGGVADGTDVANDDGTDVANDAISDGARDAADEQCTSHPQIALDGLCSPGGRCIDERTLQATTRIIYEGPCSQVPANDPYTTSQVCATCSGGVCVDQGAPVACPAGTVCRERLPAADGGDLYETRCVPPAADGG